MLRNSFNSSKHTKIFKILKFLKKNIFLSFFEPILKIWTSHLPHRTYTFESSSISRSTQTIKCQFLLKISARDHKILLVHENFFDAKNTKKLRCAVNCQPSYRAEALSPEPLTIQYSKLLTFSKILLINAFTSLIHNEI